ncbi:hypothetical protein K443DRAFT_92069 [Laccaria amethystina LaAM-08-1]|uniref:Uncharacterized protein n=1 Tax=Laccaria amethystina LaAM-08-1 TaxID=1095629 RepID=A0A0C9YAK6_9AGAR|nr:hypothetical protein K443DRAFT_92069 [Laccaria amethystina LaAM-08-1]
MSTNYRLISPSYCSPTQFSNAFSDSHPSPISDYSSSSSSSSSYAYQHPSPSDSDSSQFYPTSQAQKNTSPYTYIELPKFPTPPSEGSPFTYEKFDLGFNAGASQFNGAPSLDTFQCHSDFNAGGSDSFGGTTDCFSGSSDLNVGNSHSDSLISTADFNSSTASSADSSPLPIGTRIGTGTTRSPSRFHVAHPYARLVAKKDDKRRKIWNHVLEKSVFTPFEISTLGAQQRRGVYIGSLEAHIDTLHAQLLEIGFYPVPFHDLDPFKGLNSKTAKSMVAGLQHDASLSKLKLLELERSVRLFPFTLPPRFV